jgi:hypothetical protein
MSDQPEQPKPEQPAPTPAPTPQPEEPKREAAQGRVHVIGPGEVVIDGRAGE